MFKHFIVLGWIAATLGVMSVASGGDQMMAGDLEPAQAEAKRFAKPIEDAHGLAAWRQRRAVQADFTIEFGDQTYLKGSMLFDTAVGRVRMELDNGTLLVFDGQNAWTSPPDATVANARFDLLTWPYFLAAPMKLRDPGTRVTELGLLPLRDHAMEAAKLTFDGGVGDSPDDWYVLYRDAATNRLVAMAYIVTYGGKDLEEAEKEPHAITYDRFKTVDGVLFSTHWQFWHWDRQQGIHGKPMGQATLSGIRFVEPPADAFVSPPGARVAALPGGP